MAIRNGASRTSRKATGDYLNEHALECAKLIVDNGLGNLEDELSIGRLKSLEFVVNKIVPSLKALEISGEEGGALQIQVVKYADSTDSE